MENSVPIVVLIICVGIMLLAVINQQIKHSNMTPEKPEELKKEIIHYIESNNNLYKENIQETPIDIKKSKKPMTTKRKIVIAASCVATLLIAISFWQLYLTLSVQPLYDQGKYKDAYNSLKQIIIKSNLGDLQNKVEIMEKVYRYYNSAQEIHDTTAERTYYKNYLIQAVAACIGESQEAQTYGLTTQVDSFRKKIVQELANSSVDVKKSLYLKLDFDQFYFYPLIMSDEQKVKSLIESINNDILQSEVQKNINEQNPIAITKKDTHKSGDYWYCTGTVSNVSSKSHSYVSVRVTYYDSNGSVLTTDWTYAVGSEGIKAGENQQFEIMTKVNGSVDKYKVEVQDYS